MGSDLIAQHIQNGPGQLDQMLDTIGRLPLGQKALPGPEVAIVANERAQTRNRAVLALLCPAIEQGLEVIGQDVIQIMLAVELIGIDQPVDVETHARVP